jgi:hypothetical protein
MHNIAAEAAPTSARTVKNASKTASCNGGDGHQAEYGKLPDHAE